MTTPLLRIMSAAAAMTAIFCTAQSCISEPGEDSAQTTIAAIGDQAPDFTVEMTDSRQITLSEQRGSVVLLYFWSADCPMCQEEMRVVQHAVIDRIAGKQIIYLPIARDGRRDAIEKFCRDYGCDFAVGLDPDRSIYTLYATSFVPRMFVIDRDGIIRASYVEYDTDKLGEIVSAAENLL